MQTIHTIAAAGFVTLRVDKSGLGDSEGAPCAEIGYREELDGYRAALSAASARGRRPQPYLPRRQSRYGRGRVWF